MLIVSCQGGKAAYMNEPGIGYAAVADANANIEEPGGQVATSYVDKAFAMARLAVPHPLRYRRCTHREINCSGGPGRPYSSAADKSLNNTLLASELRPVRPRSSCLAFGIGEKEFPCHRLAQTRCQQEVPNRATS
jgi:hypothetical protein